MTAEFNFVSDPEAVETVLSGMAPCPVHLVTLEICAQAAFTWVSGCLFLIMYHRIRCLRLPMSKTQNAGDIYKYNIYVNVCEILMSNMMIHFCALCLI